MPFTPFHLGPGALLKAIAPRHFSLSVFTFAQILTDTEVLVHMANADARPHQYFHTPFGAAVVGVTSLALGRPICRRALRWWHGADVQLKEYFDPSPEISLLAGATGAFIGAFSHLALDAVVHADVRPFSPWSESNPFYRAMGAGTLHALCFLAGVVGVIACAAFRRKAL
jgi:hypothetical protein